MLQLNLSMYMLKDTCIFHLYLIWFKYENILIMQKFCIIYQLRGDNSLWKKFNTASLSARADNLLSGRIDFLPCLKKPQPFIYKRIARKCVEHIDLPALILNLHQLLHHLTTHLLADLQLQFQFIFPLFQQFWLQVFYCFQ